MANNEESLSQLIRQIGRVLSSNEAQKIAKQTGKSVADVMAKATQLGFGVGSGLVNQYNAGKVGPAATNNPFAQASSATAQALAPLAGLQMNKGTAYYGYSTTNTPAQTTQTQDGTRNTIPGSTTYNPIVLPRNMATGGNAAAGNNNGNGNGNGGNENDPYQDLKDQIAAAQQTITDLQNQQVDPYPELTALIAGQQAGQEAMAAQAAQQQQALQDLMIQQQQAYDMQLADARRQQEAMAAQAAESQRQAMAVANARVPGLEPTATAPSLGDARFPGRSAAANTLSNLAILTGLGTSAGVTTSAATPLSGLQIA